MNPDEIKRAVINGYKFALEDLLVDLGGSNPTKGNGRKILSEDYLQGYRDCQRHHVRLIEALKHSGPDTVAVDERPAPDTLPTDPTRP